MLNRLAAVVVVLMALASHAAAQPAADAGLAKGITQVQTGFLDDAVTTLNDAVRRLSAAPARHQDLAQAYLWLGIAYTQLDSEKSGRASFREALKLDPTVSLAEGWPPKVSRLFGEVRAEAPATRAGSVPSALSDEAAYSQWVARIQAGVEAGDPAFFAKVVDSEALLAASIRGLEVSPEQMTRIRNATNWTSFGSNMVEPVKGGGAYRFLRLRRGPGGRPQALFRVVQRSGSFNFHEYALRRDDSGTVRVVDLYIFTSGEWSSETLRRGWVTAIAEQSPAAQLGRLAGVESDFARAQPQITAMNALAREGKYQEALATSLQLPPSVQSMKSILLQRMAFAHRVGPRELDEAVAAFARQFPDDPGLSLLLIESYRTAGKYDQALSAVERVRQAVGEDALLDWMRAGILLDKGEWPGARAAAESAIAREPQLAQPYWTLVDISVYEKKYADAVRVLTALEAATGQRVEDLDQQEGFADFVRSDEFKRWKASRRPVTEG
jgi:tetratricopeptide (TPR) repeat protein